MIFGGPARIGDIAIVTASGDVYLNHEVAKGAIITALRELGETPVLVVRVKGE